MVNRFGDFWMDSVRIINFSDASVYTVVTDKWRHRYVIPYQHLVRFFSAQHRYRKYAELSKIRNKYTSNINKTALL